MRRSRKRSRRSTGSRRRRRRRSAVTSRLRLDPARSSRHQPGVEAAGRRRAGRGDRAQRGRHHRRPAAPTTATRARWPARRSAGGAAARGRGPAGRARALVPRESSQSTTRPFSPCTTYSSWPVTGVTTHVAPMWKPSSGGPNMPSTRESLSTTSASAYRPPARAGTAADDAVHVGAPQARAVAA